MGFQQLNEGSEVEAVKGKGAYFHKITAAVGISTTVDKRSNTLKKHVWSLYII